MSQPARRPPFSMREDIEKELWLLIDVDAIEPVKDEAAWPMGVSRASCTHATRQRKDLSVCRLPPEEITAQLEDVGFFSVGCIKLGYHQIQVDKASRLLIRSSLGKGAVERLRTANLRVHIKKCHLRQKMVKYFGHWLTAGDVTPSEDKHQAIADTPVVSAWRAKIPWDGHTSLPRFKFLKNLACWLFVVRICSWWLRYSCLKKFVFDYYVRSAFAKTLSLTTCSVRKPPNQLP